MATATKKGSRVKEIAIQVFGYTLVFILGCLLLMVVLGDGFFGLPSRLGMRDWLSNPGGVFADCSNSSNRRNKFCDKSPSTNSDRWNDLSNSGENFVPF